MLSIALDYGFYLDYGNSNPEEIMLGIPLALGGYAGYLFFTIMAMVVSILTIPYIKDKLTNLNNRAHIPYIGGATVGFGINLVYKIMIYGIPQIISG